MSDRSIVLTNHYYVMMCKDCQTYCAVIQCALISVWYDIMPVGEWWDYTVKHVPGLIDGVQRNSTENIQHNYKCSRTQV